MGGARGVRPLPPLLLRPNCGPKGEKNFVQSAPPPLFKGLDDRLLPPPLSQGLDSALPHQIQELVEIRQILV